MSALVVEIDFPARAPSGVQRAASCEVRMDEVARRRVFGPGNVPGVKVQRSGYHAWKRPRKGKRAERIQRLDEAIRRQFEVHKGHYGSPRLTKELHKPKVGAWDALV